MRHLKTITKHALIYLITVLAFGTAAILIQATLTTLTTRQTNIPQTFHRGTIVGTIVFTTITTQNLLNRP